VNAMAVAPEDWLAMESKNHVMLQDKPTEPNNQETPQLLMIFNHATQGTSSLATFSLTISIGGKKDIALVDSGSTYTYTQLEPDRTRAFLASTQHNMIFGWVAPC
jgi:hypothetical protein